MPVMTKGCPRCRGDLSRVDDVGDTYYSCVQCGHVVYNVSLLERPILGGLRALVSGESANGRQRAA